MAVNKKVPVIRFEGFDEEWEEKKLGEVASHYYGGGTPSTSISNYWNGNIPWIQSSDLEEGNLLKISIKRYITELGLKKSATKLIPGNSITIVTRVGVGKLCIVPFKFTTSQDFFTLSNLNIDIFFGVFAVNETIQKELHAVQGTSIKGITKDELLNKEINVPSKLEQTQIGNYFKELDSLIQLQEQKLEKVTNLKKAMLEKMFPKENTDVPEIRFKGFTEKWEKRKLEDMANSFEYGLNAAAINYDGINKYIRITDIDENSRQFNIDTLTSPNVDLANADNYKLKNGDILFARTGASVGKTYHYNENDGLVYFAGFLIRARIKSDTDSGFVFQNTLRSEYSKFIKITSQRSGQPGVNAQEYSDYAIKIPSLQEQQKIGEYFQNLDLLINQSQQKIEQLKHLKQALLQKMFI
jgi:type I restriction enzyme S subunit